MSVVCPCSVVHYNVWHTFTNATSGTVEELRSNIQVLFDRVSEETKKAEQLNKEKDDLEKVSEEITYNFKPFAFCYNRKRLK